MWNSKKSTQLSMVICYILFGLLLVLCLFGPKIFEFYMTCYRGFAPDGEALSKLKKVFVYCFYPSAIFAAIILDSLIKLLFNIKKNEIFIAENVRILKRVSWCCIIIAIITFIGGIFYMPFLFVFFAGIFVGILLRVLKNVMQSAVSLREENDLTI